MGFKGTVPGKCFFCGDAVIAYNKQALPVCGKCKNKEYHAEKCPICKGFLDERQGKYGTYFSCVRCSINWNAKKLHAFDK
jgi:hypothetical protein